MKCGTIENNFLPQKLNLMATKNTMDELLSENPSLINYFIRKGKKAVLQLVKKCGCILQYLSASFRADREVALAAVKECGCALQYVGVNLRMK